MTPAMQAARDVLEAIRDGARECTDCEGSGRRALSVADEACRSCGGVGEVCDAGPLLADVRSALLALEAQEKEQADAEG